MKVALIEFLVRIVPTDHVAPTNEQMDAALDTITRMRLQRHIASYVETALLALRDLDPKQIPLGLTVEVTRIED